MGVASQFQSMVPAIHLYNKIPVNCKNMTRCILVSKWWCTFYIKTYIYPSKILKEDNKQINIFIKYVEEVRKNKKCLYLLFEVFLSLFERTLFIFVLKKKSSRKGKFHILLEHICKYRKT